MIDELTTNLFRSCKGTLRNKLLILRDNILNISLECSKLRADGFYIPKLTVNMRNSSEVIEMSDTLYTKSDLSQYDKEEALNNDLKTVALIIKPQKKEKPS